MQAILEGVGPFAEIEGHPAQESIPEPVPQLSKGPQVLVADAATGLDLEF